MHMMRCTVHIFGVYLITFIPEVTNTLVAIPSTPFLHSVGAATRGQHHRLQIPYAKADTCIGSFFLFEIRMLNIPTVVTGAKV